MNVLQPCQEDFPFRRVDHDRYRSGDTITGNESQIPRHGLSAIEQRIVHVDVDDRRPVLNLLPRNLNGFFILVVSNQIRKSPRTSYIRAFTDHGELCLRTQRGGFLATEPSPNNRLDFTPCLNSTNTISDSTDVMRIRTATSTNNVQPSIACKVFDVQPCATESSHTHRRNSVAPRSDGKRSAYR